jgi:hypothetical protein
MTAADVRSDATFGKAIAHASSRLRRSPLVSPAVARVGAGHRHRDRLVEIDCALVGLAHHARDPVAARVRRREIADQLLELIARHSRSLLPHDSFGEREAQRLCAHLLKRRERRGARYVRLVVARRAVLLVDGFARVIGGARCLGCRENDRGRKRKHWRDSSWNSSRPCLPQQALRRRQEASAASCSSIARSSSAARAWPTCISPIARAAMRPRLSIT